MKAVFPQCVSRRCPRCKQANRLELHGYVTISRPAKNPYSGERPNRTWRAEVTESGRRALAEHKAMLTEDRGPSFPVTDNFLDAPDSAVVDGYERIGNRWVRR